MTIDQLNKLTDEEVRVRVAERLGFNFFFYQIILCWPNPESGNCWSSGIHPTRESAQLAADELIASGRVLKEIKEHRHEVPNYPADLNAAFTLVEKLRGEGWNVVIANYGVSWSVRFYSDRYIPRITIDASDPSLARAICLAFLAGSQRGRKDNLYDITRIRQATTGKPRPSDLPHR